MYEISGGAQWRNKADNGLCLHRPDYIRDETDVIIQKIRFREVGKVGKVTLKYLYDTGEYREAGEVQDI
jgi:twinkle protein